MHEPPDRPRTDAETGPPIASARGNVVDLVRGTVGPATVLVRDGRIAEVIPEPGALCSSFLLPGFVDAHVHVESSMLPPPEFGRTVLAHGTVAAVADPHEIANVLGIEGVRLMLDAAELSPLHLFFGAPSCVPATSFETAGAVIDASGVGELLDDPRVKHLGEVMNWPGVLAGDPEVLAKIDAARRRGKRVDGHAPCLRGETVRRLAAAGIGTDHESVSLTEALDKLEAGIRIAIREGSAAKNLDELLPLLDSHPDECFLCTDDAHPDDLCRGHIDRLVRRAVAAGVEPLRVLRAASMNPVCYYGLSVGLLQPGDPADFIEVRDLRDFELLRTVVGGRVVAEAGKTLLQEAPVPEANRFAAAPQRLDALQVAPRGSTLRVIEAREGQLVTGQGWAEARVRDGNAVSDPEHDVLKMAVVNRYAEAPPAVAFVRGFGLRRGAIASSVAHDSHNIVAVGASDEELCRAIDAVVEKRGGLALAEGAGFTSVLPLPLAGLMSGREAAEVAADYARLTGRARDLGATLRAPFMTLSFLALLVIPDLKLSDRGLFSGQSFRFVDLFAG
jgi:adenine deaminase